MTVKSKSKLLIPERESLGARISDLRKSLGKNQAEFGKNLGVSQVAVSRWEKNLDTPSAKILVLLAKMVSDPQVVSVFYQAAGVGEMPAALLDHGTELRQVKLLRDAVAAGTPRATDENEIERVLPLPRDWFPQGGELYMLKVIGDSMSPILKTGDMVIVDTSQREPRKLVEKMVAARADGGVTIKWLRKDGNLFLLVPQHTSPDHPVRVITPESDIDIVGAVVRWIGEPTHPRHR